MNQKNEKLSLVMQEFEILREIGWESNIYMFAPLFAPLRLCVRSFFLG
jgi:hypothetical protein